ncbi:MAG: oxidoreductase, partial [Acidobacteria bacterium]|nr:oxidoreductase [Acidobacteriota bacterium]
MKSLLVAALLLSHFAAPRARAQVAPPRPPGWSMRSSGTQVRLRGVSAVSDQVAWASGERGTFARTVDGGRTWGAGVVPGAEALDFRDVDAFGAETAYLLSIGAGDKSRIYKTTDGGRSWALQFRNTKPAAFFDAMAFWDESHGIAMSDPVDGRFLVVKTSDGGRTWRETRRARMPAALAGEGGFAASGTCVAVYGERHAWFGTGGPAGARVFRTTDGGGTWQVSPAPLASGQAAGVFSLTFLDARRGV